MQFACVICTKVLSETQTKKLVDVSLIFYRLTSLQVSKLDDIHLLNICNECNQKLLDFDNFRTLCLAAYDKFTQDRKETLQECTDNREELKDETDCEEEIDYDTLADNEPLLEKEQVVEIITVNNITLESESVGNDDSDVVKVENYEAADQTVLMINDTKNETEGDSKEQQPVSKRSELKCNLCDQKFRSQNRLDGHLREHQGLKPALCKICGKDFADWKNLKRHNIDKHLKLNQGLFKCDFEGCSLSYSTGKGLNAHKKKHDPKYVKPVAKKCICETCGNTFSSKGALKKHSYIHTGGMPFHCEQCNKSYPTSYKLKVHMMRHQGIKNYECSYCGLKKTTADELKLHMNYHTKEKVLSCNFCGQKFLTAGNLTRHIKLVHRGIKEFKCTHCERSFGKAETLKNHIMTHTGEKPYKCSICSKQFIQSYAFQIHAKTHETKKVPKSGEALPGGIVQAKGFTNCSVSVIQ
ncbi:gastrula zinc finger protein XlCGF57.1-like [Anopheles funestus]|uniref:gastrula zinc finger protein XlCGF57.1-like n=1 Tax=Anopheles funestus TaxID=62324 RepID=UPI0020C704D7|nr:gastrula zinc finger protein XlCGF57.1-like [Anopheles funestus]